jgi:predicted glycosyltransferase
MEAQTKTYSLTKKNILVCPLDWGLGHATRCAPLIRQFLDEGHQVIIGADKNPLAFLEQEFPELTTILIPGYEVEYDEKGSSLKLFYESVKFYNFIKKEKQFIDQILAEQEIDMIVSDNRYGLYSDKVESIIVTHQLYPKAPVGEKLLHQQIEKLLSNFDAVWIPDYEGENNLSGDLSHLKPFNHPHKFIGPLSRFSLLPSERSRREALEFDICVIISGPEPLRSVFEKMVIEQFVSSSLKGVVVRGLPNCTLSEVERDNLLQVTTNKEFPYQARNDENIFVFNHLPTGKLQEYILKSKLVICRAGYSSIMDLATLKKKAILVPTPGQTEQEYLAQYHFEKNNFYIQKQNEFDLQKGLDEVRNFKPNPNFETNLKLDFLLK